MGGDAAHHASRCHYTVSIHAPHGGRPPSASAAPRRGFRSTPPHGGRPAPIAPAPSAPLQMFRSTHPHGGRLGARSALGQKGRGRKGFDPRPRMGGDKIRRLPRTQRSRRVSIQPPAWGARTVAWRDRNDTAGAVSIHAPAWGATGAVWTGIKFHAESFDPRPRMGGNSSSLGRYATRRHGFDPRPRMGGDRKAAAAAVEPSSEFFDPRPRMGGELRPAFQHVAETAKRFRSTPRGGGGERRLIALKSGVSIHAPAWGATSPAEEYYDDDDCGDSIHAPAWGATYFTTF